MIDLHAVTTQALKKWIEVTKVNPDQKRTSWSYQDMVVEEVNQYIVTAQDVDKTGLTAFMVTRAVVRQYLSEEKLVALDLLEDEKVKEYHSLLEELLWAVEDKEALHAVGVFQDEMRVAADHYGVREKCEDTIADMSELAYIRRDALMSTKELDRHTFARGAKSKSALKYNEQILLFWNVNSLVRAAEVQPTNGISIVLIEDPQVVESSFFCFLVRDGKNISVWTDADPGAHPMQKHMSRDRSRGRDFEKRAARLRFPYQFLKVRVEDGYAIKTAGSEIVRTNIQATPVAAFADMEPHQLLWSIMTLDVLRKAKHKRLLSVVGEGMLTGTSSVKQLPAGCLEVKPLTNEEVSSKISTQVRDSTGANDWMLDRYVDQVDERVLNLVKVDVALKGGEEDVWMDGTPMHNRPVWWRNKDIRALVTIDREKVNFKQILPRSRGVPHKDTSPHNHRPSTPNLIGVDPVSFGSPKEMEANRVWIGRWNQAQALALAAQAEFDKRHKSVAKWYRKRVLQNKDAILEAAVRGTWVETFLRKRDVFSASGKHRSQADLIQWHRKGTRGDWPFPYTYRDTECADVQLAKHVRGISTKYPAVCFLGDAAATLFIYFKPCTAVGIAMLAGCGVEDLPEPLEYWDDDPPYAGNDILDRTDPLDTSIGNPWAALRFGVHLALCKREWNKLSKGHEPLPWETRKSDGRFGHYWSVGDED